MPYDKSFAQKLHGALFEGLQRGGSDVARGYIPADYDPTEPEVTIEFDWEPPEPKTFNYPGSPGGIWINRVATAEGREFDIDTLPPELLEHLTEIAGEHLNKQHPSRDDVEADRADMMRDRMKDDRAMGLR